jgi:uncharacterized repeat protein (TIGR03803 family)
MGTPIMDAEGNIYGTSYGCNPGDCSPVAVGQGWGAVWEWTNTGSYKVLYYFNPNEGVFPIGGLAIDKAGNLYGTTEGAGQGAYPDGTVFQLSKSLLLTVLHAFSGTDGAYPVGALTADSAGHLYGTTYQGGAYGNGTVFEVTPPN